MLFQNPLDNYSKLRQQVVDNYTVDENKYVDYLLSIIDLESTSEETIQELAIVLVHEVRTRHSEQKGILAFIRQYNLSTEEGVVLMCLAEALLRIPDSATANKLIRDKLSHSNWEQHLGASDSLFVNASTWGLMLSGKIVQLKSEITANFGQYFNSLISKSSEPFIRAALKEAMHTMGKQFVVSESIEDALTKQGLYSFDMLGEAAITPGTAEQYFKDYLHAIETLAHNPNSTSTISIKLSALHCRYELAQSETLVTELYPKLELLITAAMKHNVAITIDAEESNRLDLMLDAFYFMYQIAVKHNWPKLGLAVQAYQFRSLPLLKWLDEISSESSVTISVRLVKGAYWDSEIKTAQQLGLEYYPVFTRKENTDLSYLCSVQYLFGSKYLLPQFATHNAHTIAAIIQYSKFFKHKKFEFQRLFGMGELLYDCLAKEHNIACRTYAPVGNYKSLLPYLVRRLLENGANSSFIQKIENPLIDIESITRSPIDTIQGNTEHLNPTIPLPRNIYSNDRKNASGLNLSDFKILKGLDNNFKQYYKHKYCVTPFINGQTKTQSKFTRATINNNNPCDLQDNIGTIELATADDVSSAMMSAKAAFYNWSTTDVAIRADCLNKLSNLIEENTDELLSLCVREAGRCIADAISELRETIDFCRYYAHQARSLFDIESLVGTTGESNILKLQARGVYCCISPWNFPLAIFTGQIVASLVTGNCVVAKPAQQTSLCAFRIVELCYQAGIPKDVLHFIPSSSADISDTLLKHPDLAGVVFTGSLASATKIKQALASREGAIVHFIAETSGMNAMIVDSSALPEQVAIDVLNSAFNSAGQRCSSLRFLYIQNEVADNIIELLRGAVSQLKINKPQYLSSDIGPLIDDQSKQKIVDHIQFLNNSDFATKIFQVNVLPSSRSIKENNTFLFPSIYEISHLSQITGEVFGPVLHIIRYKQSALLEVVHEINASGFGLSMGIHSRISSTINTIIQHAKIGNIYVNRNIIGAVVGVQPFGGQGCSGTGPKAGGPYYLKSFCTEQVISTNTTAVGGNSDLLNSN